MVSPSRSARSSSSFVQQYIVLSSEKKNPAFLMIDAARWEKFKWGTRRSKEGHCHEHSGSNTLLPK